MKERGFLLVGLDSSGDSDLRQRPCARRSRWCWAPKAKACVSLTRATCDHVARLDMPGAIKSLNVSNAAALALYVAHTRLK